MLQASCPADLYWTVHTDRICVTPGINLYLGINGTNPLKLKIFYRVSAGHGALFWSLMSRVQSEENVHKTLRRIAVWLLPAGRNFLELWTRADYQDGLSVLCLSSTR
jgi:hypothetical protein